MTSTAALLAQDAAGIDAYADAEESAVEQHEDTGWVEDGPGEDDEAFYLLAILGGCFEDFEDAFEAFREDTFDPDF